MSEINTAETPNAGRTVIARHGYKQSGVSVYVVQCSSKERLNTFVSTLPGCTAFEKGDVPVAYSHLTEHPVLIKVLPEAVGDVLISITVIAVVASGGEVTPEEERRCWAHEIGHVAYFFGSTGFPAMCEALGFSYTEAQKSEAAAYMAEYLTSCVECFTSKDTGVHNVSSGLPFALPWMDEYKEIQ